MLLYVLPRGASFLQGIISIFRLLSSTGGGEYYLSIYAYSSSEPGDLTFNQGDMIMVSKKDGDWWTGTINGQTGVFPANYVKEMESQVRAYYCILNDFCLKNGFSR